LICRRKICRTIAAGKIYPKERIEAALAKFLHAKESDAPARNDADRDHELISQQRDAAGSGRMSRAGQVMVAISSQGPDPGRMLRKIRVSLRSSTHNGMRFTFGLRRVGGENRCGHQRRVIDRRTAQKMGGLVFSMKGEDVADTLISFAMNMASLTSWWTSGPLQLNGFQDTCIKVIAGITRRRLGRC
jgi:K+-sensing histidine kinase KdpD